MKMHTNIHSSTKIEHIPSTVMTFFRCCLLGLVFFKLIVFILRGVCVCERFLLLFVFFVSIDRLRALCKWCYSLRLMRVLCVCCVLSIPNHQIVVHILLLTMVRWCGCLPVFFGIMVGICYWTSFSNELSGNFGFCLSIDFDGMVCQWQWLVHWTKYKVLYLSRVAQLSAMNAEIRNGLIDMMAAI